MSLVPTLDSDIQAALFYLSEPRFLFAELLHERRSRLAILFNNLDAKQKIEVLTAIRNTNSSAAATVDSAFFSGPPELVSARQVLLSLSQSRASSRLAAERQSRLSPGEQFKKELLAPVKTESTEMDAIGYGRIVSEVVSKRPVSVVRFAPTSTMIAIGDFGGHLGLYDSTTMKPVCGSQVVSAGRIHSLVWINGHIALCGDALGTLSTVTDGHTATVADVHSGHSVTEVLRIDETSYVMTTGSDGYWCLLDLVTGQILSRTTASSSPDVGVSSGAIHADISLIAVGMSTGDVSFWDLRTGRSVHTVKSLHGAFPVHSMDWRGNLLLSGGGDQRVQMFDLRMRKIVKEVLAGNKAVSAVKWLPTSVEATDGFMSTSLDGVVKIYQGEKVRKVDVGERIMSADLTVGADEKLLVAMGCYDRVVRVWTQ
jgi:U4/U6 small nuclear ribonucleoprotein PRP4